MGYGEGRVSVYVDSLRHYGFVFRGRPTRTCHMIADTESELAEMAHKLALPLDWRHEKHRQHYDLTESWRKKAIKKGAIARYRHPVPRKITK